MCKRTRRKRTRKQKPKPNKTPKKKDKNKKKLTCCQRCRRRIRIWSWRRLKRCIKRTIFGYSDPQLDDFELAGYNLGSIRDKFKYKNSKVSINKNKEIVTEKKPSAFTLYRKYILKMSVKSFPIKDTIVNEIERYSLSKSIGQKLRKFFGAKDSQQNYKKLDDNQQIHKQYSNNDFLKNIDTLKKRFSLTLSKGVILKNMVDDYKNKKYSFTDVIDKSKYNKSKFDINDFEKKDLDKIISHYRTQNESKVKLLDKKLSIGALEIMNKIDPEGVKKKFSLTNSRHILLKNMIDDVKNKKFELSAIPENLKVDNTISKYNKFKSDINDFEKKDLDKIISHYKAQKKSKLKLLDKKLSIGELETMNRIDPEGVKKKFSLTDSRQMLLKNMIDDLKNKNFELSGIPKYLKIDIKKIYKENLSKILDYYKSFAEKKRFSFIKQSRIKQMKSDVMAKLNSISISF